MLRDTERIANLAENLRAAMHRFGWTQQKLEAESGVPQPIISRILNAKGEPGVITVWRLAEALQTSLDKLLASPVRKFLAKSG
ncbi:MAG: helix-turn-helix transcriptional regulator [Streptosporangiaceae bacterium]|jgi:transcriptional regulator with XRE-family HTH domain